MNKRRLRQISDRVWMIVGSNRRIQPNVGIIVNQSQTILVDCGNSPLWGDLIQELLDSMGVPPVSHIIYTHHHWDHVFGAMSFDAQIIAHKKCLEYLKEEAKRPWGADYLKKEVEKTPRFRKSHGVKMKAIPNWDDFYIRLPQITFQDRMTLELADGRLYMEYTNGAHSDDSILVYDEKDKVMFAGDAFYPPPYHDRKTDIAGSGFSKNVLRHILTHELKTVIHGHGMPLAREDLIRELNNV